MSNFGRDESKKDAKKLSTLIRSKNVCKKLNVNSTFTIDHERTVRTLRIFYFQGMVKDWGVFFFGTSDIMFNHIE